MIGRATVLTLLAFACATPASADTKSEALLRDFVAWVDSSPEWSASVSLIRSDGGDTLAEGLVFSRDAPHVSISIEELRLHDLAERDGGGFRASEIELKAGEIVTDTADARIPSATLSDTSIPSLAGITLDPKHLMRSMARFYAVVAAGQLDAMSIPEITVVQRQPNPGGPDIEVHASYKNLSLDELSGGVIKHEGIGPVTVATQGDATDAFSFGTEKIEADHIDVGAMAHILDETQYRDGRGDNVWRPLLSRFVYSGITADGADGTHFRLNEVAVENVDGRQPEKSFADSFDQIMDPTVPQDAKNDLALEAVTGMAGAFRVGTIRLDAMSAETPKVGASFSLDGFTLSGWSAEGLDSFIMKPLRFEGPQGFVSLGSMELSGFVSPDLRTLMQFAALEKGIELEKHAEAISKTFAALPRLSHFALEKLVAGPAKDNAVSLEHLSLDFSNWNKIFAEATDFRLDQLTIPRTLMQLDPDAAQVFDGLGYDKITAGLSFSDRWASATGTDVGTLKVTIADAGDLDISYTLNGLTTDWLMRATAAAGESADSEAALTAMLNDLSLARASVSVTDNSLLDRAFKVAAEKQGLSIDGAAYREQMRAALPFIISAVIPAELAQRIAPPLQAFMAGRQILLADVAPPMPLGLMELFDAANDPLTLPDRLHLELKSEAP